MQSLMLLLHRKGLYGVCQHTGQEDLSAPHRHICPSTGCKTNHLHPWHAAQDMSAATFL